MSNETNQNTQAGAAKAGAPFAVIAPVLFGFFIMGFVDFVGRAAGKVQSEFGLSDTMVNTLASAVFLWFLILSIPTSLLMNRIGRKNTVLVSLVITFVAMLIPFIGHSFAIFVIAFIMVGIGNAIIQVSLNPLLTNVVRGEFLTSSLNYGQFIKAIASLIGAPLVTIATNYLGGWKMAFLVFAVLTVISAIWLFLTPIKEEAPQGKVSTFGDCFSLLGDRAILFFFLGILCVVGIDVGMNFTSPKILEFRCGLSNDAAGYGQTIYFAGRTIGAFIGASLLLKFSPRLFFIISMAVTIAAMGVLLFMSNLLAVQVLIFVIGFAVANVFGIIFGAALQKLPAKANEISGLMIMGVSGGAIFPLLMGVMSDATKGLGAQVGAVIVLLVCAAYLMFCAFSVKEKKA